jgi:competence protein ComEA
MNLSTARNYFELGPNIGVANRAGLVRQGIFVLMFLLSTALAFGGASVYAEDKPVESAAAAVNINAADAATLAAQLSGVGPSRAEDIVRYRETYGKFASVEELAEVKGIGQSTLEKNRHLITLE